MSACLSSSATAPFNVTFAPGSTGPVNEGSACVIGASFTVAGGGSFTPATIKYQVDDLNSGDNIVPLTSVLSPAASVSITVTGPQNDLLSDLRACEEHQLTLEVTDGEGNLVNAPISWTVQRIFPS